MTDNQTTTPGTLLTCDNPDCPCEIRVVTPCPHGDSYTCGCGHPLVPQHSGSGEMGIGERAEAEGIVDQQAVLADDIERSQQGGGAA